jgi:hypothetical protein
LVAVKVTVNVPAAVYWWDGFWVVAVTPSPKSQLHDVGAFVEVSVKLTVNGAVPDAVDLVNEATGATAAVTVCVAELLPSALVAVSTTLNVPAPVYWWDGFWVVAVAPSPKSQLHDVGVFAEVSVKLTVNGTAPDVALFVNDANGAASTVTAWGAEVLLPPAFVAVRVTSNVPAVVY